MTFNRFLVLNSNGDGRVTSRFPSKLKTNEVAFRLRITVPDGWAKFADQAINVELPPPPAAADVEIKL